MDIGEERRIIRVEPLDEPAPIERELDPERAPEPELEPVPA